ncbi:MAG: hypothetical protein E7Z87_05175 [Cyanobacteria bacterium SIG26]|nr:hypothetical protein [Cyanobacteria bacterium SIG26]
MRIDKITPYLNIQKKEQPLKQSEAQNYTTSTYELRPKFNDYLVSFGERVEKTLTRFYRVNKERMPKTVEEYVRNMEDRDALTPLEAQQVAFAKLASDEIKTVEDIKKAYPTEPLFENLVDIEDTKATRGILNTYRINKDLLKLMDKGILKDKQDLTVYLVKKFFLEAKTIDEVNEDLEKDFDEDFKADFRRKNPDSKYIHSGTLDSFGIKLPDDDYLTSLRYTRDGYADYMGAKIQKAQIDFWNSLSYEQRTEKAKRLVQGAERFWGKLTKDELMEMLAADDPQEAMLKEYRRFERARKKTMRSEGIEPAQEKPERVKVGSNELRNNELFKMWASNNLQNYLNTLSEADKDTLHLMRMRNLVARWKNMSPTERTDYIDRMKKGGEASRYAMIEAWNNCKDIIMDLSTHLKEYNVYKPTDVLYSSKEFSEFQSRIMTEFWDSHPEYAQKLGDSIKTAAFKIELAIKNGTFNALKEEINRNKNQRIRDIEDMKKAKVVEEKPKEPRFNSKQEEFKYYHTKQYPNCSALPKNFWNDYYNVALDGLDDDWLDCYIKYYKNEPLNEDEKYLLKCGQSFVKYNTQKFERALEAALADALYTATGAAEVFAMECKDIISAANKLERGESFTLKSDENGKIYEINAKNKKKSLNPNRVNYLYEQFKQDLSQDEIDDIITYNFLSAKSGAKNFDKDALTEVYNNDSGLRFYIDSYGRSANVLFSDKTAYPVDVKMVFASKFYANMPEQLRESALVTHPITHQPVYADMFAIIRAKELFGKRFSFLPKDILDGYFREIGVAIRTEMLSGFSLKDFVQRVCKKRQHSYERGTIAVIPKSAILDENTKLKLLAYEQALADVLYDSTKCKDVYNMSFEVMCDKLELFALTKKFPLNEPTPAQTNDGKVVALDPKKRINFVKIDSKYKEYMTEIKEWQASQKEGEVPDYQDLLYILNPEAGNAQKDYEVAKRIIGYFKDANGMRIYETPIYVG